MRPATVPLVAHLASIATLVSLYFMRTGSFSFDPHSKADWFVTATLLLLLFSGMTIVVGEFRRPNRLTVSQSDLSALVTLARADASVSVINIGGDLSWLVNDLPSLRALRLDRPELDIRIFYKRGKVPPDLGPFVAAADAMGVRLIPYPDNLEPAIRCMFVDRELPDSARVQVYSRAQTPRVADAASKRLYIWEEYGRETPFVVGAVSALVQSLEYAPPTPLRIGITGANNVGKTRLASRLRASLATRYEVTLITDQFRIAGGGFSVDDNYTILLSQLMAEFEAAGEICIFDRTSIDNLAFLLLRANNDPLVYQSLAPKIQAAAQRFNLIFDIGRLADDFTTDSTCVTRDERKAVRKQLTELLTSFNVPVHSILINPEYFDDSIAAAAEEMRVEVTSLYRNLRLGLPRTIDL